MTLSDLGWDAQWGAHLDALALPSTRPARVVQQALGADAFTTDRANQEFELKFAAPAGLLLNVSEPIENGAMKSSSTAGCRFRGLSPSLSSG